MTKALVNNWIILVMIAIAAASFGAVIRKKSAAVPADDACTVTVDKGKRIEAFWDILPKNLATVRLLP